MLWFSNGEKGQAMMAKDNSQNYIHVKNVLVRFYMYVGKLFHLT